MQFFATVKVFLRSMDLQRHIQITNLPDWCASIDKVLSASGERGEIYCTWGQFNIHREVIRDGVRFTLPGCPNALQWTVTAEESAGHGAVVVHCTINRDEHDQDFIDSLQQFVTDWKQGLEGGTARIREQGKPKVSGECMPTFGGFG